MELRQSGATLIQVLVLSEDIELVIAPSPTLLFPTPSLPPGNPQKMTRCQHCSLGLSELKAQTSLLGIHSLLRFC